MGLKRMMQNSPTKAFCRECNEMVTIARTYCGHFYCAKNHLLGFDAMLAGTRTQTPYPVNKWSKDNTIVEVKSE
jgi:hypothetical protein